MECICISNLEMRFQKTHARIVQRSSASSPTSRGWSPGMAVLSCRRCGRSIIPSARGTRRSPIAHLVSRMARRTAITTYCSVTLLRYRPGPPALDPLLQSPRRAVALGPSLPPASALLAQRDLRRRNLRQRIDEDLLHDDARDRPSLDLSEQHIAGADNCRDVRKGYKHLRLLRSGRLRFRREPGSMGELADAGHE